MSRVLFFKFGALGLALGGALSACGQVNTLNSFSTDPFRYSASGSAAFIAARSVIVEKCSSCHFEFATFTEEDWVATGWVVGGDPEGSYLFSSIDGSDVSGGRQDMPPDGTLSTSELSSIRTWIDGI